jgi:dinuclear metal center YbgI/SA1388 family protein
MVPTVADIVAALATKTRPEAAAEWDPVGLQLGDAQARVNSVGICHEVTEDVVAAIEASPVDLLVTYHPLLFEPVNRLLAGRSPSSRAMRLLGAGVNLLVTHTDFDAARGGTADALAALLGLRDVEPFGEDDEGGLLAIGRVGRFGASLAALDAIVSDHMGHAGLRISGDRQTELDRVAVVPGSGSVFIPAAAEVADAMVTGDVSHHSAVAALDLGLCIVDPGHIATERPGINALLQLVRETVDLEVVDLTEFDPVTWS